MKKSILKTFAAVVLFVSISAGFAAKIPCPPGDIIKNAKLIHAHQHPHDSTYWNFVSAVFIHDGNPWSVEFGTFFPTAKTEEEALKQGQIYFDQAALVRPHPKPVKIHHDITLCDYIPEGREYFISALNPPQ